MPSRQAKREDGQRRIVSLVALTMPSEIAISRARGKRGVNPGGMLRTSTLVRRQAALGAIPCEFVGPKGIARLFQVLSVSNKYEMAAAAADIYQEILWKLPPGRKRWQTEPRAMLVFDALAAGLAYWHQQGHPIPGFELEGISDQQRFG
ncbi:MAG TPA: hypothetical protein VMI06_10250 [Terriglobia bacterium]|nr:hypothetical protein [Terriglobia bacterium]